MLIGLRCNCLLDGFARTRQHRSNSWLAWWEGVETNAAAPHSLARHARRALFSDTAADHGGRGGCSPDPESSTEFQRLHGVLAAHVSERRPLFLAGHSIGGALAAVFAQGLHARWGAGWFLGGEICRR